MKGHALELLLQKRRRFQAGMLELPDASERRCQAFAVSDPLRGCRTLGDRRPILKASVMPGGGRKIRGTSGDQAGRSAWYGSRRLSTEPGKAVPAMSVDGSRASGSAGRRQRTCRCDVRSRAPPLQALG